MKVREAGIGGAVSRPPRRPSRAELFGGAIIFPVATVAATAVAAAAADRDLIASRERFFVPGIGTVLAFHESCPATTWTVVDARIPTCWRHSLLAFSFFFLLATARTLRLLAREARRSLFAAR